MENLQLHVVSLNVPYPADYGGVIDIFYKIKALFERGAIIHLHCFEYGRPASIELEKYCASVRYYRRQTSISSWLSVRPYIVRSRKSGELLKNLVEQPFPILFEGLHTTFYIGHPALKDRLKIVRAHNVEHDYYWGLFGRKSDLISKIYFLSEALKLKVYERVLHKSNLIAAISPGDALHFENKYGNVCCLPPFHPYEQVTLKKGIGNYVLFHADLSVPDNLHAVDFLLKAFENSGLPLVIAGRSPSHALRVRIGRYPNVNLVANPTFEQMDGLISNAQVLALPTFQATGIKLKLIASLFQGRHLVVTPQMVENTGLEEFCHVAKTQEEFAEVCKKKMVTPLGDEEIHHRKILVESKFDNLANADVLINLIRHMS